jgi:hypothetical protein
MRAACLLMFVSGCSLIYDGSDLKGKASGRPKFVSSLYTGADDGTTDLAAGDVDGDGFLDLVSIEHDATSLLVYLGHGDGTFATPTSTPIGCAGPVGVAAADLDGDGMADVVVACDDDNSSPAVGMVSRLMATGGGGFAAPNKFVPAGKDPAGILIDDINGDGHPDVLIANATSGDISLLRGVGDGTFAQSQVFRTGDGASYLATGDLDGDGNKDVAVTNDGATTVSVLLNQGGTFGTAANYATDDQPLGVAIGDFDKKNGADLALVAFGFVKLDISLDQGGGVFPGSLPTSTTLPFDGARIIAADFDRDGHLDLAVGAFAQPELMILYGVGDGTFEAPLVIDTSTPGGLVVADFDGDGKPDVAVGGDGIPGNLTILLSR